MKSKNKNSVASALLVVLWCFGGVSPSYEAMVKRLSVLGVLLNYCSPFRWSFELQTTMELERYSPAFDQTIQGFYATLDYSG